MTGSAARGRSCDLLKDADDPPQLAPSATVRLTRCWGRAADSASGPDGETTIRDGCRLSYTARPSRRNSGENRIVRFGCSCCIRLVNPTGICRPDHDRGRLRVLGDLLDRRQAETNLSPVTTKHPPKSRPEWTPLAPQVRADPTAARPTAHR